MAKAGGELKGRGHIIEPRGKRTKNVPSMKGVSRQLKRLAKAVSVSFLLGLAASCIWLLWLRDGGSAPVRARQVTAPGAGVSGGEALLLEIFAPGGQRRWRLRLVAVTLAGEGALAATGVLADYYGTRPPALLTADRIDYQTGQARLAFRGGVRLTSPALSLTCTELVWDERSRSFSAGQGYVLTRGESVMRGERLWVSEDFRTIRALGAARLSIIPVGGGAR